MSNDIFMTVAFTGHRTERFHWGDDEQSEQAAAFIRRLKDTLEELIATGVIRFLSGAARGFDTIAAETVLELRDLYPWISLTVVLPCDDQADKWGDGDKARWEHLLERADHVLHLAGRYDKGCLFRRNRYLVDHSSLLVAAYDGRSAGGTAMTLAYAAERNRTVVRLPLTGETARQIPDDHAERALAAVNGPMPEPIREIA